MRADKFLFHHQKISKKQARLDIAQGKLVVNNTTLNCADTEVSAFDTVIFKGSDISLKSASYLMLHKPVGYVSATIDSENKTVIDLIKETANDSTEFSTDDLHLAGRLDKNTTGLILLTNDGKWSKTITTSDKKVAKVYLVESQDPITAAMITSFRNGIFFEKENITSQPAIVKSLTSHKIELTIYEGIHHQIKRMFLKFGNRVTTLHRKSIGGITLDVPEGTSRPLTLEEYTTTIWNNIK